MKFINDDDSVYIMKLRFVDQLKMENVATKYDAGTVCERDGNFVIGYEMKGAEDTFSVGQPVYDVDGNIMGWLGIGLYSSLDYSAEIRIPCEYWQICLPTKHCVAGKKVYTYWQNKAKSEVQNGDT